MEWNTVIITNVVQPTKTAFAVREDNGESVFIPPAVSKTLKLQTGDILLAKLVPNSVSSNSGGKTPVPWFSPLMARTSEDVMDPDEVNDVLCGFDYPVTSEEAEVPLVALEQAYQAGRVVKIMVMPNPRADRVIMWAADMDRV